MQVFTESMNQIDLDDTHGSIKEMDRYIRYMIERIEFSVKNVFRTAAAAGASSADIAASVAVLRDTVSSLSSSLGRLQGDVTTAQGDLLALQTAVGDSATSGTILYQLNDLAQRVTALEQTNNHP